MHDRGCPLPQTNVCRRCNIRRMERSFYEKALFVKPTWRLLLEAECNGFECPSRAMLLFALSGSSLCVW